MKRTIQLIGLLLLMIAGQFAYGQTDKEKALEKGKQAVKLEDEGKFDETIKFLYEALIRPSLYIYSRCIPCLAQV